jgi:cysteine-rich repeat protein
MVLGSSGECVENCGDGLNFGLMQCDDGNSISGDGCSSSCEIETDWECKGGSPTSVDNCSYVELNIVGMTVTPNNNLVI